MAITLLMALVAPLSAAPWAPAASLVAAAESPAPTLVSATVRQSLEATLWASSPAEGRALAAGVARLLRWRGDIRRLLQAGDKISLLFLPAAGGREPVLQAVHYDGAQVQLAAYRFVGDDGVARHYGPAGERIEPVMRNAPVPAYEQITELMQRGPGRRRHRGDDLKAPAGSEVVLPFAGVVTRTNWHRRKNGLCVEVRLDAGYTAHFLHLSAVEAGVRRGQRLAAGTRLGEVGSTGRSSGAHLHYELLRGSQPVEPLAVHGRSQAALEGEWLERFVPVRDALARQLRGPAATVAGAASR